jgi:hypothetical protein
MDDEQYCYQVLADLRKSYERDAKPYIDRLAAINSMRPAPGITLTLDQAREFIDFSMSARDEEEANAGDDMMGASG